MRPDNYAEFDALDIDLDDHGILTIVISTPGRLNAVDEAKHRALADIWPVIHRDQAVRCVLIHGADGAFSAGGDLEMVKRITQDWDTRVATLREARDIVLNMVACEVPIVSAIERVAVGAGIAVALLADVPIAGRSAKLIDGHTKLGVAAGDHAAIIWPLLCGMAKAKYHLMTCEPLTGEEAERIGLVAKAVDDDQVLIEARRVAEQLAGSSRTAVRFTKHTLNHWLRLATPGFDASVAHEMLGFTGPDVQEGIRAIEEKRSPRFD